MNINFMQTWPRLLRQGKSNCVQQKCKWSNTLHDNFKACRDISGEKLGNSVCLSVSHSAHWFDIQTVYTTRNLEFPKCGYVQKTRVIDITDFYEMYKDN